MLQFDNVKKYYGGFLALEIPALFVCNGLWWVKGENGSGKSTFLKMIAGIHPFAGKIVLENKWDINRHRQQFVRLVNFGDAEPLYPSFLTAADLVELYCETKNGDLLHAKEMLKQLRVFDAYKKRFGTFSSGMTKKVSLVLAFIGKPKLILLDEPLITLDASAVDTICKWVNKYHHQGVSFMITSHQVLKSNQLPFTGILAADNRTITNIDLV